MKSKMKHQAKLLSALRTLSGISQNELGKHFGFASGQTISNIERGDAHIPATMVPTLCKLLNAKKEDFVQAHCADIAIQYQQRMKR